MYSATEIGPFSRMVLLKCSRRGSGDFEVVVGGGMVVFVGGGVVVFVKGEMFSNGVDEVMADDGLSLVSGDRAVVASSSFALPKDNRKNN